MIFINKEQEEKTVSQAWNLLYQRLERDGLLTNVYEQKSFGRKIKIKTKYIVTGRACIQASTSVNHRDR